VWKETRREGFPASRHVCVEENNNGRGKSPLIMPVWKETRWKGFPPSCCACVEENNNRRGFPTLIASVKKTTTGRGKPPSRHACVEGNTTEGVFPLSPCLCGKKQRWKGGFPLSFHVCFVFIASVREFQILLPAHWGSETDK
jgi:hypothetical protein